MANLLNGALLSLGLLAGVAGAAQAQSVSALPPEGGMPVQATQPPAYSSTQSFYPKPGGSEVFKEQHYQPPADYAANRADHPYSTSIGPAPGAQWSGRDTHYEKPPGWDSNVNLHPYTSKIGPALN